MILLALACATPPVQADPVPPPPPTTVPVATPEGSVTVPTLLGEAAGVSFLGDWTSGPCQGRSYARNVRFEEDFTYAVIDLVSPCPVGTTCMWSGMATFAGEWRQDGTQLKLRELGIASGTGPGGPHPVLFESNGEGKLVENGCIYEKGLTVPTGYAEDKVRPKVPGR